MLNYYETPSKLCPLTFAIINDKEEISNILIKNGANVHKLGFNKNNLLHYACFYGKFSAVQFVLNQQININAQNEDGNTPLHLAVLQQKQDCVEYLLKNNANTFIFNK